LEVVDGEIFGTYIPGTLGDGIIDDITGVDAGVSSTGNLVEIRMRADNSGTVTIGLSDAGVGTATETLTPGINNGAVMISGAPAADTTEPTVTPSPWSSTTTVTTKATASAKKGLPGFEGTIAIAGLLAIGYVMMRRKR
jgi:PGF-CTERM protein